jgi:ribbon-helix-helix CopG family protein
VPATRTKGKLGGRRPGAGRPVEIQNATSFTFDVSRDHLEALSKLAAELGVSRGALMREAIASLIGRRFGR